MADLTYIIYRLVDLSVITIPNIIDLEKININYEFMSRNVMFLSLS